MMKRAGGAPPASLGAPASSGTLFRTRNSSKSDSRTFEKGFSVFRTGPRLRTRLACEARISCSRTFRVRFDMVVCVVAESGP